MNEAMNWMRLNLTHFTARYLSCVKLHCVDANEKCIQSFFNSLFSVVSMCECDTKDRGPLAKVKGTEQNSTGFVSSITSVCAVLACITTTLPYYLFCRHNPLRWLHQTGNAFELPLFEFFICSIFFNFPNDANELLNKLN